MTPLNASLQVIADNTDYADPKAALVAAKCTGLMLGYDARWAGVEFEVLSVEEFIQTNLFNPDTDKPSRTFTLGGKKDVTVRYQGETILIDHKTTSDDIDDPDSVYWRQLAIEAQPSHYMLMDWIRGNKIDKALWDVVRKPGIRPKEISKADVERAVLTKEYCGYRLTDDSLSSLVGGSKRETLEMYTARLADDCIRQQPNRYFQRKSVPRLDHQLVEHAEEVWAMSQEILIARRENRWFRNPKACMAYGTPCKYLGLCTGRDTPDSPNWIRKAQIHSELPILDGDGRDVLTFSRLATYQDCRRKSFYAHELGLERVDADESDSRYFGTIWHFAQEAWWLAQVKPQIEKENYGNNYAGSPSANAVGGPGDASQAPLAF